MSTIIFDQAGPVFPVPKSPPELKLLTSQQIANTYYEGKPTATGKGYKIYTDEPTLEKEIEEVTIYKSRFSKKIGDTDLVLFASKNGAFLLQRYLEAVPQSKELILFLEIDDKYNTSTVLRAVAGSDLTRKDSEFADILSFVRKQEVTITPKVLKELIEEGIYRNKVSFISWFLGLKDAAVSKIFNFYTQGILSAAAEYFKKNLAENISSWRIPENGWNPKKENYEPALIPEALQKELKPHYEHTNSPNNPYAGLEGQKQVVSKIVDALFEKINAAKKYFLGILDQSMQLNFFPEFLFKKISKAVSRFFDQFDKIGQYLKNPTTGLQKITYKSFRTANALFCGIYNSIIDIIAGLFSLIGFLFDAVAALADVNASRADYGEMFLELTENMLEGIFSFDYGDFVIRWVGFQIATVIRMADWVLENVTGISLESVAYYYGYIVGLIIDIIVETLLTGGTAAVAKLMESAAAFIKNPLAKLEAGINKIVGAAKNLLDRLIDFITFISNRLKKGSEAIFTDLNKFIDEVFGFGEDVADNALTPKEKRWKDNKATKAERQARKNGTSDFDWMSSRKTGNLGGNILKESQIRKLRGHLKEKGIDLIMEGDTKSIKKLFKPIDNFNNVDDLFYFMKKNDKVGAFNPYTKQMILPKDTTEIIAFHEMNHVKHMEIVGEIAYKELSILHKEMYVWKQILANRTDWTKKELMSSLDYINDVRTNPKYGYNLEPLKIK